LPVPESERPVVTVIGLADDRLDLLSPEAKKALSEANVVVGGRRHLALFERWNEARAPDRHPEAVEITADTEGLMARIRARLSEGGGPLCVLASGDPGFFGIVRTLLRHVDRRQLRVLPAPSSVATAFARLGIPWDDAVVVSAHGRPLDQAVRAARTGAKVAVLTAPESPPELVGQALLADGCIVDLVAVCSRLGSADEEVRELSLGELAEGEFDPLSVVVLLGPGRLPLTGWSDAGSAARSADDGRVLAWGRDDATYAHRDGMITKAETRSVILGKLCLPPRGVLWDVGAGSGSVAIECALLCPGLTVFAIESSADDAARISANATHAGVGVHVITGTAPEALVDLPAPDRAFVGGGGTGVLQSVLDRLAAGGHVVASFAALDRAVEGARLLGHLVPLRADRGERLTDGSWRLVSNNPVFVAWGRSDHADEPL
jgi:precorrin-6B C5,15-methyltransferase / cobalt-precorrin-6B C5,C15-methyltransferase